MNYTINQLQIFLKIVQLQSVTKASEALFITQPAVSIQLKNFQEQFEIPLTEVVGRKIHITEFGREIAVCAENILNQMNTINHKTLAYKGLEAGKLKISIVSTGKYIMPYFLSNFMNKHKGIELSMAVTNKQQVVYSLERNEVDFALVSILPTNLEIEKMDLMPNKLFLVGNSELQVDEFKNNKKLISNLPLIYRENGSGTRKMMETFLEKNYIAISKKMELTSNEAVKQAILAGLGFSLMPIIGIKNELLNKELHIIPLDGLPIETTWSLIWLKGKNHSPIAQAYLKFIEEEKTMITDKLFNWHKKF